MIKQNTLHFVAFLVTFIFEFYLTTQTQVTQVNPINLVSDSEQAEPIKSTEFTTTKQKQVENQCQCETNTTAVSYSCLFWSEYKSIVISRRLSAE